MKKYLSRDFIGKICRNFNTGAERKQIKGPGQKLTLGHARFQMPLSNGDFLFLAVHDRKFQNHWPKACILYIFRAVFDSYRAVREKSPESAEAAVTNCKIIALGSRGNDPAGEMHQKVGQLLHAKSSK
jgi:hypothetical protein